MQCPQCHSENLNGATHCYACAAELIQDPASGKGLRDHYGAPASDGPRRYAVYLIVAAVVLLAAVVGAVAFASGGGGSSGASAAVAGSLTVAQQAKLMDAIGRGLDRSAQQYQGVLAAVAAAAADNKAALKRWGVEWKQLQADYRAQVAAVQAFNASHLGTRGYWRSGSANDAHPGSNQTTKPKTNTWVPATPAQHEPLPSEPSRPPKIVVPQTQLFSRLDAAAVGLAKLESQLSDAGGVAGLEQTATDARTALKLMEMHVAAARAVIRGMVTRSRSKGDVILPARLISLSVAGIGDAIQAVRIDLRTMAARLNLPDKVIPWASR